MGVFTVERRFGQPVFGDSVTQHAARLRLGFEDHGFDPFQPQVVRGGDSGGAGADNGYLFAAQLRQLFHVFIIVKIRRQALEVVDGDRFVVDVAAAVLFAETGTDAADRHRQRNPLLDDFEAVEELSLASGADVLFDVRVGGTGHRAGRFAVAGVFRKQQRKRGLAHVQHFRAGGFDLLSRGGHGGAARHVAAALFIADHADETAGGLGDAAFAAERRDLDSVRGGDFQYGLAGFRRNRPAVQDKFDAHRSEPFMTR
ncbi:hypothetical protein SDC9_106004 [bioreactor metagenome]|uniref:Uncharacterized protein n=1 Tax=bioreactor metagenome TaxID=1076179 RepID=A0A645B126_9ZZZZ